MESNRLYTTICLLLCLFIFTHCVVDARSQVGFERRSKSQPKMVKIKSYKHASLLEKMMTQLNLAQPLDYSSSSNTQYSGVGTALTLPPLSVPENGPPFCVTPPNTPGLSPPPSPTTIPNPPDSSSNPNSIPNPPESSPNPNPPDSSFNPNPNPNPNPPESSSNPNPNPNPNPPESSSNPNPPDTSSNPNPPITVPSPPESSSNPNPPDSSSNPNPPIIVPYPPETSNPNPPETVPSPGQTPNPSGPISGPPYNEPGPPYNEPGPSTPTPSGGIPTPTGSFPSPSSGFLPPIVYPPPMTPPLPSSNPTSAYWCVAKPSVPDPIIQEAMNFACGSGADCSSIQPNGPCFKPNTLWAHASFAFNSYWQRTKGVGGSCTFGGTGMLVTVDPSYKGCHFDFF